MSIKHGKKDYIQLLLDPNRSKLLHSLAEANCVRVSELCREMIYGRLEEIFPSHQYQLANAQDKALWRESVSNRVKGRKKLKKTLTQEELRL